MQVGLMMECEQRVDLSEPQAFREAFELADIAETSGLDEVWLAERHFASPARIAGGGTTGGVPSFASAPLLLASAIAARTDRIRVGIAVSVLPLSHPVRLAEEVATLDQISGGRLDFGIGRSGFQTSYEGYGVAYSESRDRFHECLDILRLAWTRDSFDYAGEFYSFKDVSVVPKPLQAPYPPLRIAATTEETFPMAGEMGYPIFVGLRGTDIPETTAHIELYQQAWHEAGHAGEGDVILRIPVYVAAHAEAAYEEPRASTMASYARLAASYAKSASVAGAAASEDRSGRGERLKGSGYDELLANRLAYGTPEAVSARLLSIQRQMGLSGIIIEPNVGGAIPRENVVKSIGLIAEEVLPNLK